METRDMSRAEPDRIVFVGGAPRSGTTVTHALICTSTMVNRYSEEISFFRAIPQGYRIGLLSWQQHTSNYFPDREAFRQHMRASADLSLHHIWHVLDRSPILAVKDPDLTPHLPEVHQLYPDKAYFVTVARHPYDVVRSRQEVHDRSGSGRSFSENEATQISQQYVRYYSAMMNTNFSGRHFAFRYEDLNSPQLQSSLAAFVGIDDLHARPMWGKKTDLADDPWASPKYFKPIDLTPRLPPLAPDLQDLVKAICSPLMQRFGYK